MSIYIETVRNVCFIESTEALAHVTHTVVSGRKGKSQEAMFGSIARATPARSLRSKRHTSSNR